MPDGAHKELKPVDFTEPWQYNHSPWPRVVPFWQLQLYNGLTGLGKEDFYAQVSEIVRKTNYPKGFDDKSGELQVAFAKNSCDVMQADMTPFFIKCGMLRAIDDSVSDYGGSRKMLITQAMIDEVVNYASKYQDPASPVIHYISVNSLNAFKNRSAVVGQFGQGVSPLGNNNYKISHDIWKNVVVFEAYAGNVLKCVTMVGTGTTDNSSTTALVPEGCDRLVAVAWDGIRIDVIRIN